MKNHMLPVVAILTALAVQTPMANAQDTRELVTVPAEVTTKFLAEMRSNVVKLDEILAAIADGNFKEAANIADLKMGFGHAQMERMAEQGMSTEQMVASKEKMRGMGHGRGEGRGQGQGIRHGKGQGMGRYMPDDFRALGQNLHQASEDLAARARAVGPKPTVKDYQAVISAVEDVTSACTSCHQAYRVR